MVPTNNPPQNYGKILEKALKRYQQGRLDEASHLCQKILKRVPREPNALHLLGVVHLVNERGDEAAETLKRAAQIDTQNAEIHSNLGSALRASGHTEEAEASFRRAADLQPARPQSHFNLGNLFKEMGRRDEAIEAYRRATELDPGYADAFNNLGLVYEARNETAEAESCYTSALAADAAHREAERNLAQMLMKAGRAADSLRHFEAHLARHPDDVTAENCRGVILSEMGRHDKAVESFRRALDRDPDFVDARVNIGNELCLLYRPEEALVHFELAAALDPECVDTISNFGHALRQRGRLSEAIEVYERGLALDPDNLEANFGAAVTELSRGAYEQGWRHYLRRDSMRGLQRGFHRERLVQDLTGKRILIEREQGLGDELFFLRFLPLLRERQCWVAYHPDPRLAGMLGRSGVAQRIVGDDGDTLPFDLRLALGDLPYLLGVAEGDPPPRPVAIPVGKEQRTRIEGRLAELGQPPYIGVTWRAGTPDRKRLLFKEAPLEAMSDVLKNTSATIVSVQRNPAEGEIETLSARLGRPAHDLSALNADLEAMLAVMARLDDYVCVSNTNVHLRASAGKGSRVLVPGPPEFRWMARGKESPWFPGTRVYRQSIDGSWRAAFDALTADLEADADSS